jgi:hypothetical protein
MNDTASPDLFDGTAKHVRGSERKEDIPKENELILVRIGFSSYREGDVCWRENPAFLPEAVTFFAKGPPRGAGFRIRLSLPVIRHRKAAGSRTSQNVSRRFPSDHSPGRYGSHED